MQCLLNSDMSTEVDEKYLRYPCTYRHRHDKTKHIGLPITLMVGEQLFLSEEAHHIPTLLKTYRPFVTRTMTAFETYRNRECGG